MKTQEENTTKEELVKEFGQYLRSNWDDRETLPVADWWLDKLDLILKEKAERIEGLRKANGHDYCVDSQDGCSDCAAGIYNNALDLAIKIINE